MAQDLSAVKSNVASDYSLLAGALVRLINQSTELRNVYLAQGFPQAGTSPIVQGDLTGSNSFLTPQVITNVDAILATLTTTFNATQMNQLRQAVITPVI